jgi:glycosyltransferase 2 family protein
MRAWLRSSWPVIRSLLKYLFVVAILVAIGRRFALDLQGLIISPPLRPGWFVASGLLYLLGLGLWALYWHRLLYRLGQRPTTLGTVRAYYVSQVGKYLPGKAWALFLRAALARGPKVRTGVAIASSFYEVLTTMSAGALIAAVSFTWATLSVPEGTRGIDWRSLGEFVGGGMPDTGLLNPLVPALMALVLLGLTGVPILPPIFNRIVHRLARPFRQDESFPLPRFSTTALLEGMVLTSTSWFLFAVSLWTVLQGITPEPPPWTWSGWSYMAGYLSLSYVAGFIILIIPNGLGIRELLLSPFLAIELERLPGMSQSQACALAALAVIALRAVWFVAEMVMVAIVYWLPAPNSGGKPAASTRET